MRIGEVAEEVGVSTKTIRYYESIALLPEPPRSESGYRVYDERAVERLGFIRDAQESGLSLAEVASVLELKDSGSSSCGHTLALVERHLADVERQLERLQATRSQLQAMAERARELNPAACTDPDRCQVIDNP